MTNPTLCERCLGRGFFTVGAWIATVPNDFSWKEKYCSCPVGQRLERGEANDPASTEAR